MAQHNIPPVTSRNDCVGRQLAVLLTHCRYEEAHSLIEAQRKVAATDRRQTSCPCGLPVSDLDLPPQILGLLEAASIIWTDELIDMLRHHERELLDMRHFGGVVMGKLREAVRPFERRRTHPG